jgi:hypothetical protein
MLTKEIIGIKKSQKLRHFFINGRFTFILQRGEKEMSKGERREKRKQDRGKDRDT